MIPRTAKEAQYLAHLHRQRQHKNAFFPRGLRGLRRADFEVDHSGRWIAAGIVFCVVLVILIWSMKP